ncbi:hypothetical protein C8R47DRAFT_1066396 [Mycena vitilis]|nr:hypothetical protein C8R47DRAFT_1066396 [Mycena vitilis]
MPDTHSELEEKDLIARGVHPPVIYALPPYLSGWPPFDSGSGLVGLVRNPRTSCQIPSLARVSGCKQNYVAGLNMAEMPDTHSDLEEKDLLARGVHPLLLYLHFKEIQGCRYKDVNFCAPSCGLGRHSVDARDSLNVAGILKTRSILCRCIPTGPEQVFLSALELDLQERADAAPHSRTYTGRKKQQRDVTRPESSRTVQPLGQLCKQNEDGGIKASGSISGSAKFTELYKLVFTFQDGHELG